MRRRNPHVEPAIRKKAGAHVDTTPRGERERQAIEDQAASHEEGLTFGRFVSMSLDRFRQGRAEYGDSSYDLPHERLVVELSQEAQDLIGWGFILWSKYVDTDTDHEARFLDFLRLVWNAEPTKHARMSGEDYAVWIAAIGVRALRQSQRVEL